MNISLGASLNIAQTLLFKLTFVVDYASATIAIIYSCML